MANISYKIELREDWNDYMNDLFSSRSEQKTSTDSKKKKCTCNKCKPSISSDDLAKLKAAIRKQVIAELNDDVQKTIKETINVDKVVQKVIETLEPHETSQSSKIQENRESIDINTSNISEISNISVWGNYTKN